MSAPAPSDPLWYKDAVIYQLHVKAFFDCQRRRRRRLRGPDRRSSITSRTWGSPASGSCPSIPRRCGTTATTSPTTTGSIRPMARWRDFRRSSARPTARAPGGDRTGDQPHLGPAPLVSAGPAGPPGLERSGTSTSGRDTDQRYPGTRIIFHRYRKVELVLGSGGQGLLLAPVLLPPAGPEFRQSGGVPRGGERDALLAGHAASTACGWTPSPTWCEREGT